MGFSINKVTIVGNLGRDAETRFTTNNVGVTNFSLVTEHSYKDKNDEWQKTANWHNVVGFDLSDWIKDRLVKGNTVYLEGRISNTSYDDKEGVKKYKSEIILDKKSIITFERERSSESTGTQRTASDRAPVEDNDDLPF